ARDPHRGARARHGADAPRAADRARRGERGERRRRRGRADRPPGDRPPAALERTVRQATAGPPLELRFLRTADGLIAFLTLGLDGQSSLDDAHARASEIEELIRKEQPDIAAVIVHTEPCD